MDQESKIREVLKKTQSPLIVNLYLKALAGFSSLECLYGITKLQQYPQNEKIITDISDKVENELIDNIHAIVNAINCTLPNKYWDLIPNISDAFSTNLWIHSFLNNANEHNLAINKKNVLIDCFKVIFQDIESTKILYLKDNYLPYDTIWALVPPLSSQSNEIEQIKILKTKLIPKYNQNEYLEEHALLCKSGINTIPIDHSKKQSFNNELFSLINSYSKTEDYDLRFFYISIKKFSLYKSFLDIYKKERTNTIYKDFLKLFFNLEFIKATLRNTLFLLPQGDLSASYEHLGNSNLDKYSDICQRNSNICGEQTPKKGCSYAPLQSSITDSELLQQSELQLNCRANDSSTFYMHEELVKQYEESGRPINKSSNDEIQYFFSKWKSKVLINEAIFLIDYSDLLENGMQYWLEEIYTQTSSNKIRTSFYLIDRKGTCESKKESVLDMTYCAASDGIGHFLNYC